MSLKSLIQMLAGTLAVFGIVNELQSANLYTDPNDAELPPEFRVQGEYVGQLQDEKLGAQVIALGGGHLHAVLYPGGLPGVGWDEEQKILLSGTLGSDGGVDLLPVEGQRKYLANDPVQFSAVKEFPPKGQEPWKARIEDGVMSGQTDQGQAFELKQQNRLSPSLGMEPPEGAIVLFDGTSESMTHWKGGRLDAETGLLNTDGKDIRTQQKFDDYTMHIEFMLPFKPGARGQGRGNSGFYQVDHYEVQILDSFGLEGLDNECGGIYKTKAPDTNMCLPPLTWQTYDVDFQNADVNEAGEVQSPATITIKHNGVVIHDQVEIPKKTGGSRNEPLGTPGPIKLQGHGNPLQFRNVWILPRS